MATDTMTRLDPALHGYHPLPPRKRPICNILPALLHGGYYVSVIDGSRFILALGPFGTDDQAEAHVEQVRRYVTTRDRKGFWYGYGTSRVLDQPYPDGRLNKELMPA